METYKIACAASPDALAQEALASVLQAHASLEALTAQSPEQLRMRIRSVNASIARSAREIDGIVRWIDHSPSVRPNAIEAPRALFAETDVEELGTALSRRFSDFCATYRRDLQLMFEPGKFLV